MIRGTTPKFLKGAFYMSCSCRCSCIGLALAASIILGIVAALLRITAIITVTPAFLWTVFGIAVLFLVVTFASSVRAIRAESRNCICSRSPFLLTGVLGTILTSVILLAITFPATSIVGAIITGLLIFFFSLMITAAACTIKCIVCSGD